MSSLLTTLATTRDLLLVVLGFSLIIVIHELGHFLAARWAGVRVLAFAVDRRACVVPKGDGGPSRLERGGVSAAAEVGPDGGELGPGESNRVSPERAAVRRVHEDAGQDDADPGIRVMTRIRSRFARSGSGWSWLPRAS